LDRFTLVMVFLHLSSKHPVLIVLRIKPSKISLHRHKFVRVQDLLAVEAIGDQRSAVACAVVRAPIKSGTLAAILKRIAPPRPRRSKSLLRKLAVIDLYTSLW
jgi:hypothetical protein